ncbi:MAG: aminodeoxychorismate/anthranilate synthase component II [Myxococcales bacterium]|nr:aminodeoxychorismate/anthranilate synthase component II [Myxococcales bacterium]
MRVLLVDNYDSFTWNLHDWLLRGADLRGVSLTIEVVRNDAQTATTLANQQWSGVVLSPGPKDPQSAGVCLALIEQVLGRIPIFGVCLGHQAIAQALGGRIVRAKQPMHGKVSQIAHDGTGCLRTLPSPFAAMRYHSLVVQVETLPTAVRRTAWLADEPDVVMALDAPQLLVQGVQFHPESIGTPFGVTIASNVIHWFAQTEQVQRGLVDGNA